MLKTLELLKESPIVKAYDVLDFKQGKGFYFLKARAKLIDEIIFILENLYRRMKSFIHTTGKMKEGH